MAALLVLGAGAPAAYAETSAPVHLRDTGLYADWDRKIIRGDAVGFSPQYPLWTDGARKRRFILLPKGKAVDASDPDAWRFPRGTRLWKEFGFDTPVETRYLERLASGEWLYATYVWSADGKDAVLAPARGVPGAHDLEHGVGYDIPGIADCRACHEGSGAPVLGFSALQLSPDRDPAAPHAEPLAAELLDLPALVRRGLVRGLPARFLETPPRIAAPSPTARAALGYLSSNCGGCHNRTGPLAPLGLVLAHSLTDTGPGALGTMVGQSTRQRVPGLPEGVARIAPGQPDASMVALRVRSRHPLRQMPPLGTKVVDREAVALLERWIAEELGGPSPSPTGTQENQDKENAP
jgi:hypothetical protein